jgi:large subunit ribosomal protein L10
MALTKSQKQAVVADLESALSGMETIVFVNFKGLTVSESNALRRILREAGVGFKVVKKTLLARVLATKGIHGEMPELPGETAIAFSTDALAPAREVYTFAKGKETPAIVGGVFEGSYADKEKMLSIATIPSREVLLSQIAFLLKSPLQRLAIAVNEVAKTK